MMTSNDPYDLDDIRTQAWSMLRESEDLYWRNYVGLTESCDLVSLYREYEGILSLDILKYLCNNPGQNNDERRRNKRLLTLLTYYYQECSIAPQSDEITNLESRLKIEFDGQTLTYRGVGPAILREADRSRRLQLIDRKAAVTRERILPLKNEWYKRLVESSKLLGYPNYRVQYEHLLDRSFETLQGMTRTILETTADVYAQNADRYLQQFLGIPLSEAHITDLLFIRRGHQYDKAFTRERLIDTVMKTWLGLGFDLQSQKNITLDTEDRPTKVPRACIVAVNPPDDVRLSVYPIGGPDDYEAFLHESGHAEHMANMVPGLEFEYRYFGDRGFTEGLAYLMQRLTINRDWLRSYVNIEDTDDYLRFVYFFRLWSIRRLIGEFHYEMELHDTGSSEGMADRFVTRMKNAVGAVYPPESFLDIDTEFYVAGYIRASLFETQVRTALEQRYGTDWWRKPRTKDFMMTMFRFGRKFTAEEILEQLNLGKLDPQYFLQDILSVLS